MKNYSALSIACKSAMRWCSHVSRIDSLFRLYSSSITVVNYEDLCQKYARVLVSLDEFLQGECATPMPEVKIASLSKKDGLTDRGVSDVRRQISSYFANNPLLDEGFIPLARHT